MTARYKPGKYNCVAEVIVYISITLITATQSLTITPPGDDVLAGRPFTLQCRIRREAGNTDLVQWKRGGYNQAVYSARLCGSEIVKDGFLGACERVDEEVHNLTIVNVTVGMDNSEWICSRQTSVGLLQINVTMSVKVMVTSVTLDTRPVSVLAGNSTTFTCTTSPSKPRACIRWYVQRQGTAVRDITTGQLVCNQPSDTPQVTTKSQSFTATPEDNGANLYCTATNRVTETPVPSQDYTLDVQYLPRNGVSLTGYVTGEPIESEQTITLTCNVGDANPSPTLTWSPNCGNNIGIESTIPSVSKSLNGKSCVCRGNQEGSLARWLEEKSVIFNITFGPDSVSLKPDKTLNGNTVYVTENTTVTFNCTSGESNPLPIVSFHNNSISILESVISSVSQTRGPYNGYFVSGLYSVTSTRYQDGDVIRCEGQREGQGAPVSSELTLDVKYKPQINCDRSQLRLFEGQRVNLICVIHSKPVPVITWAKDGVDIGQKYKTQTNQTSNTYSLSSQITVPAARASDSGVFVITGRNNLGASQEDIVIDVVEGQSVPREVKVISCRNGQAELIWPSGISTTVVEYYKLESRTSQTEWEGLLVRNPGQGRFVEKTLAGLQTGVQYEFRVQPNTDLALSEYATNHCTIHAPGMTNLEEKRSPITGAGIGVGIVVGGVIVIIVEVLVWMFRRGNRSPSTCVECMEKKVSEELPSLPVEEQIPTARDGTGNYENMDIPEVGHYEELNTRQSTGPSYDSLAMNQFRSPPATGHGEQLNAYENTLAI